MPMSPQPIQSISSDKQTVITICKKKHHVARKLPDMGVFAFFAGAGVFVADSVGLFFPTSGFKKEYNKLMSGQKQAYISKI